MIKRKPDYKQMTFETAIRNPERYKGIIEVLNNYDGLVLNLDVLLNIVCELYLIKEVSSSEIQINENTEINNIKELVIKVNLTRNSDGGFPKGFPSRFWTYVRTLSELGLVYARYNEKLIISDVAKSFLHGDLDEQEMFSSQAIKTNRRSPYRNVLNDYNYFRFILNVLLKLREENMYLSYNQFVLSLFSYDGNVDEFISLIKNNKFLNDYETYEFIKEKYKCTNSFSTVMKDYPDVVLRMLRICGFITIKYNGYLKIKINELKLQYIIDILKSKTVLSEEDKDSSYKYFCKLNEKNTLIDDAIKIARIIDENEDTKYINKLDEIIKEFNITKDNVVDYINLINTNKEPKQFKYIPNSLKLEFYISLLLYFTYGNEYTIKPNYKADEIGMPISHAPGNIGDIEVYTHNIYWLIEVTLIRNKQQQYNHETTSVVRHMFSNIDNKNKTKYLSFVAPYVHEDTQTFYRYCLIDSRIKKQPIFMNTYSIKEFLNITNCKNNIEDMESNTNEFIKQISMI